MEAGMNPEAASLSRRQQPLELMLDMLNDASLPHDLRLAAARYAAPYCHAHKGQIDTDGISRPLVVQILRFSPEASEPEPVTTIEHNNS
jgi:hypothetical protein